MAGSFLVSCNKKDASAPVISLIGQVIDTVDLHGIYSEKGATANDTQDGDLTTSIDISGEVDTSQVGFYTISYSVSDKAGNTGLAKRSVLVKHTLKGVCGNYSVSDECVSTPYNDSIILDTIVKKNRINGFGNFQDAVVYLELSGATNSIVSVPQQTILCGAPPVLRIFKGEGTVSPTGKQIMINYTTTTTSSYTCKSFYNR